MQRVLAQLTLSRVGRAWHAVACVVVVVVIAAAGQPGLSIAEASVAPSALSVAVDLAGAGYGYDVSPTSTTPLANLRTAALVATPAPARSAHSSTSSFAVKRAAKPGTSLARVPRSPTELNTTRLSNKKRWGRLWGEGADDARDFVGRYSAEDLRGLGLTADTAQELSDFYRLAAIKGKGSATSPARADLMQHYADVLRAAE